jgi:hypothetical protein
MAHKIDSRSRTIHSINEMNPTRSGQLLSSLQDKTPVGATFLIPNHGAFRSGCRTLALDRCRRTSGGHEGVRQQSIILAAQEARSKATKDDNPSDWYVFVVVQPIDRIRF